MPSSRRSPPIVQGVQGRVQGRVQGETRAGTGLCKVCRVSHARTHERFETTIDAVDCFRSHGLTTLHTLHTLHNGVATPFFYIHHPTQHPAHLAQVKNSDEMAWRTR